MEVVYCGQCSYHKIQRWIRVDLECEGDQAFLLLMCMSRIGKGVLLYVRRMDRRDIKVGLDYPVRTLDK